MASLYVLFELNALRWGPVGDEGPREVMIKRDE